MNILVSIDLKLYTLICDRWPHAVVQEVDSLNKVIDYISKVDYNLLALNINILENEELEKLLGLRKGYDRMVIFFNSRINNELIRQLMLNGVHTFLSQSATETEIINMLNYLINKEDNNA